MSSSEPSSAAADVVEPLLARYASLVRSSPHNLVSARAREELLERHVPECVAFAELLPSEGVLLDLGSGGGFPGMVIAIVRPGLDVHLLDATAKKTRFLHETASELGIQVTVHTGRAEQLGRGPLQGRFSIVSARALASLAKLTTLAAPFLAPGGRLLAIKGKSWADEIAKAGPAMERAGLRLLGTPATHPELGPHPDLPNAPRVVMLGSSMGGSDAWVQQASMQSHTQTRPTEAS